MRRGLAAISPTFTTTFQNTIPELQPPSSAIRATANLLARHPGLGRDTDIAGIRVLTVARYPYFVYHTAVGDELTIVHVRHSSRASLTKEEL